MFSPFKVSGLFVCSIIFVSSVNGAILQNGGFDDYTNAANDTAISGLSPVSWIGTSLAKTKTSGGSLTPQSGDYFAGLFGNGSEGTAVWQTFTTVPGTTYAIEFLYGRNNNNEAKTPKLLIDVFDGANSAGNGDLLDNEMIITNPAAAPWAAADSSQFHFTASSTTTTLRFQDGGVGTGFTSASVDPCIESVSVTIVPEPTTLGLISFASGGLMVLARKPVRNNS